MESAYEWLRADYNATGSPQDLLRLGRDLAARGDTRTAATAYDRAHGLDPASEEIAEAQRSLLDKMALVEHGIRFRYVPAGAFQMGSDTGDPDERPVHPVQLDDYWLSETPVSWAAFCDLIGWAPPPDGLPKDAEAEQASKESVGPLFYLDEENKIRLQYCEDATSRAIDWHAHAPRHDWVGGSGTVDSWTLFGKPPTEDPRRPWRYDRKPMVSVSWLDARDMCEKLSTEHVLYCLPTEAEWERAARGSLIGCRYPWGNELPTRDRCDFDRFDEFSIRPVRRLPPNGYGLYGMAGSVWEWTADWYDAQYYKASPVRNPTGPSSGMERVLRGGSWADCAEAVTVSFRMSRGTGQWREGSWGPHLAANIGFRLCRKDRHAAEKQTT